MTAPSSGPEHTAQRRRHVNHPWASPAWTAPSKHSKPVPQVLQIGSSVTLASYVRSRATPAVARLRSGDSPRFRSRRTCASYDASVEDESRCLLVVEDDSLTAALLSEVLVAQGFEVEVAQTAAEARHLLDEFAPDAALLDIVLGHGPSGVGLAHLIAREYPATAVLFLTRFRDAHAAGLVTMDMPAGCAFLRKDRIADATYLVDAIEAALRDHPGEFRHDLAEDDPLSGLTPNQQSVLRMVAQGLTNSAIARRRGITPSAVEQSLSAIFRSLGIDQGGDLNPRVQAARLYIAAAGVPEQP